jgi:F0F1-type ATP synthase gamma subunit
MPVRENIDEEIVLAQGLKALSQAYEEISVMRMGQVRGQVIASRPFREGLMKIFAEVRASHQREIVRLLRRQQRGRAGDPGRGRKVAVLLSSNEEHWSGTIAQRVAREFLSLVDADSSQRLIVTGRAGRDYLKKARPQLRFSYLELPDYGASLATYKPLITRLRGFDQVTIFYGKSVNFLEQAPTQTTMAASPTLSAQPATAPGRQTADRQPDYLFEPGLPAVLKFFDTQISAILFRQIVSESDLAQLGSRITAMEQASQNIDVRLKRLRYERLKHHREIRSQKQRERLAGMSLWGAGGTS